MFDARLAQGDDTRVLCGKPDCRDQVARVLRFIGPKDSEGHSPGGLYYGPGWELEERGEYRLLHRTRGGRIVRRISDGRGRITSGMNKGDLYPWANNEIRAFPTHVRCATDHTSILKPDVLHVTIFDTPVEAL